MSFRIKGFFCTVCQTQTDRVSLVPDYWFDQGVRPDDFVVEGGRKTLVTKGGRYFQLCARCWSEADRALDRGIVKLYEWKYFKKMSEQFLAHALTLIPAQKYDEAATALEQSIKIYPTDPMARHHLGCVRMEFFEFEEAVAAFDRSIALRPKWEIKRLEETFYWRGVALLIAKGKRREEALESFEQAIRVKWRFADAWMGKSVALILLGRGAEATDANVQAKRVDGKVVERWKTTRAHFQERLELLTSGERGEVKPDRPVTSCDRRDLAFDDTK